jgi:3-hydroxyacyl-CoA dehydrogenase/enoyl-CoA hydratase/3-hydroxybutyryl-CoA epimerase
MKEDSKLLVSSLIPHPSKNMAGFETPNLRVDQRPDGIALLRLDAAGRSVNVFNRQVLTDLDAALDHVKADDAVRLLVFKSNKKSGFVVGADLQELGAVRGPEEAAALSALGQRLFDKLAGLRVPTVALIHGPCLGGGLEAALACDYRLVVDSPKTQFGLPEVELGLLPAWGGTQRLPRAVGLERALQVILGGRRVKAREARRWGLADALAATEDQQAAQLNLLIDRALLQGKAVRKGLPLVTWRQRLLESNPLGRLLLFRGTERVLRKRVPDDMPAPAEALHAVHIGITQGMEAGLAAEREAVRRLATSVACRNLVGLFLHHEQARKAPADADREIRKVAVVGAGTMGAGIAQLAALRGYEVTVREVNEPALAAGVERIRSLFDKAVQRKLVSRAEADRTFVALRRTTGWDGFADADLVVEAVIEDLALKRALFRDLEGHTRPDTLLATNTSSLQVAQLQEGLQHPERVAGLHFFNPVHRMPLVEVVRAPTTEEAANRALVRWAVELGKTPVTVKDGPGFVVNRILMPYLDEAVRLVAEGLPIKRIDQVMRRFGMPMGPLELLDQVGLDVAAHIARAFGESARRGSPDPAATAFGQMVERGWLGQKNRRGFYRYRGKSKRPNGAAVRLLRAGAPAADDLLEGMPLSVRLPEARERMVLLMVNEAFRCLEEGMAADADTIDLAMVLGTGWAPHRGGPLHYAEDRGPRAVLDALESLAQRYGPRFAPCDALRKRAEPR